MGEQPPATVADFDALIDLTACMLPLGASPDAAVVRVRELIEGMPGTDWISVDWIEFLVSTLRAG